MNDEWYNEIEWLDEEELVKIVIRSVRKGVSKDVIMNAIDVAFSEVRNDRELPSAISEELGKFFVPYKGHVCIIVEDIELAERILHEVTDEFEHGYYDNIFSTPDDPKVIYNHKFGTDSDALIKALYADKRVGLKGFGSTCEYDYAHNIDVVATIKERWIDCS